MRDVGDDGVFNHAKLNQAKHRTYLLETAAVPRLYTESGHPYAEFILNTRHHITFA